MNPLLQPDICRIPPPMTDKMVRISDCLKQVAGFIAPGAFEASGTLSRRELRPVRPDPNRR